MNRPQIKIHSCFFLSLSVSRRSLVYSSISMVLGRAMDRKKKNGQISEFITNHWKSRVTCAFRIRQFNYPANLGLNKE